MRFDPRTARPRPWPVSLWSVALAGTIFACSTDSRNDSRGEDDVSSNVVETRPEVESTASVAPEGTGDAPTSSGGPLDACTSKVWTDPSEPKREAACTQYWDETGPEPMLRYVCSCDVKACPIHVLGDQKAPNEPPSTELNDCVVDGVASGCSDSLLAACGLAVGQHGYCEREYYGLTPTRADQEPPTSATIVCFDQSDGTHACQCPELAELVLTAEPDCDRALLTACQTRCDSVSGECVPTETGYDCVCTAGFSRSVETGLCEYALFHACEPACSNESGACYWDPSGGPNIICRCNDDVEPRILARDPNVDGDECGTPLLDTCGGSAEGPNAWP